MTHLLRRQSVKAISADDALKCLQCMRASQGNSQYEDEEPQSSIQQRRGPS